MHDVDDKKCTPLMWAIEARKPLANIETLMSELDKAEKDFKDDSKLMAIHYLCKFGVDKINNNPEQVALLSQ